MGLAEIVLEFLEDAPLGGGIPLEVVAMAERLNSPLLIA